MLALQGAFREHIADAARDSASRRSRCGCRQQLDGLDGLVIPGGESTAMLRLMGLYGLDEAIRAFPAPIFGTCAGMIVARPRAARADRPRRRAKRLRAAGRELRGRRSRSTARDEPFTRRLHPRAVGRRGRARASLSSPRSTGIRCSRARGAILVASFHPELTDDTRVHERFLQIVREEQGVRA